MNIVMMTNTYKPFVGGVTRSVETFSDEYRKQGHNVLIVAPTFENIQGHEDNIVRVPALQKFNGSDFSVPLPVPGILTNTLDTFEPDIIHSHHPYLIGDTAFRCAMKYNLPLFFTYHTQYEQYTHYVPADSTALKRFVIALSVGYANMCVHIFAPSESMADIIRKRGVERPIDVVPTGVDTEFFSNGNRFRLRRRVNVGDNQLVLGFVSRLAPEKNVEFLSRSVVSFLKENKHVHFFVIGSGPSEDNIKKQFEDADMMERLHCFGTLNGSDLIDAYHAMDVFVFASKTETQGMVLIEAMASGIPVVAIDADGIREVVCDRYNGRLLQEENETAFVDALQWFASLDNQAKERLVENALKTADTFSKEKCAHHALELYASALNKKDVAKNIDATPWEETKVKIQTEWNILKNIIDATEDAIKK